MSLPELRAMFQLGNNATTASQWDDFEDQTSPWRPLCPQGQPLSIKTVQAIVATRGIYSKTELVKRIQDFVQRVGKDQVGNFTCYFPFRDRAIVSVHVDLRADNKPSKVPTLTEFCVFRGAEEFRETYCGLPMHLQDEKVADISGSNAVGAYHVFPRCMIDTCELTHTIAQILRAKKLQPAL